jgi:hypothetical protein
MEPLCMMALVRRAPRSLLDFPRTLFPLQACADAVASGIRGASGQNQELFALSDTQPNMQQSFGMTCCLIRTVVAKFQFFSAPAGAAVLQQYRTDCY